MFLRRIIGLLLLSTAITARAEDGSQGWLRYAPISNKTPYAALPSQIVVLGNTPTDQSAANELQRGLTSMLGRPFAVSHETTDNTDAIVLANLSALGKIFTLTGDKLPPESYTLGEKLEGNTHRYIILGADARGELYGAFHLLELVGRRAFSTHQTHHRVPLLSHPLGQPMGQPQRLHRARLRRPQHLLRQRPRPLRPHPRPRLRPIAGLHRDQRGHRQQRQL